MTSGTRSLAGGCVQRLDGTRWRLLDLAAGGQLQDLSVGYVKTTVRCVPVLYTRGDLRYCTYRIGNNGKVTVRVALRSASGDPAVRACGPYGVITFASPSNAVTAGAALPTITSLLTITTIVVWVSG